MLNFCISCFNTKVSSNKVSSDGYEVTNLVSSDAARKCKGFLAYNGIKTPVEINFELICDIYISHIIVWPQVGQQKSCGFKIEVGQKSQIHLNNLITVGQSYIENDGIVFKGNNCRLQDIEFPNNFSIRCLSNKKNVLNSCSYIKLSVLKTLNSTLPAIKSVEIWGECSATCSPELKSEICQTWQHYKSRSNKTKIRFETINDIKCTEEKRLITQGFVVPDDFIDPITCEIMSIPMILPCGKIIDRSTLEKHEKVEAAWGRMPNDPFTGTLFTESNHPIIAVSLKSRIDKFLVDNSDKVELFTVPRTLGRCLKSLKTCNSNASLSHKTSVTVMNSKKRRTQSIYECEVQKKFVCNPDNSVLGSKAETKTISLVSSTSDEELDLSLQQALKNTLSGLPSFLKSTNDYSISKKICADCTQLDVLYTLPCNHFLCRKCLLKITGKQQLHCTRCHHKFIKSDVSRINT